MHPGEKHTITVTNSKCLILATESTGFVFSVVITSRQRTLKVAFFKWDYNSPSPNIYSPISRINKDNFYIMTMYVRGKLYNVLERIKDKYIL